MAAPLFAPDAAQVMRIMVAAEEAGAAAEADEVDVLLERVGLSVDVWKWWAECAGSAADEVGAPAHITLGLGFMVALCLMERQWAR